MCCTQWHGLHPGGLLPRQLEASAQDDGMLAVTLSLNHPARPLLSPYGMPQALLVLSNGAVLGVVGKHPGHQQHRSVTDSTTLADWT